MGEARREYERQNQLTTTFAAITRTCNCQCKCQEKENKKFATIKEVEKTKTITKSDGTKINLLPKNISKRKKRELSNADKKKKDNSADANPTNNNGKDYDDLNSTYSSSND